MTSSPELGLQGQFLFSIPVVEIWKGRTVCPGTGCLKKNNQSTAAMMPGMFGSVNELKEVVHGEIVKKLGQSLWC